MDFLITSFLYLLVSIFYPDPPPCKSNNLSDTEMGAAYFFSMGGERKDINGHESSTSNPEPQDYDSPNW